MAKLEKAIAEFKSAWEALPEDRRNQVIDTIRTVAKEARLVYAFLGPAMRSATGYLALLIAKEEFSPFGMGGDRAVELVLQRLGITEKEVEKCLK